MSADPKPCPFCGEPPKVSARPDNAAKTVFFACVVCYCGGFSATAHKMATAPTRWKARSLALAAWNQRHTTHAD
jgi:hypothetical protein